jgi:SAM-dependent methyltransferase
MSPKKSDKTWNMFGKSDPYFGVFSHEDYKSKNLDQLTLDAFFASGEEHINQIVSSIERILNVEFKPTTCLDFGCGVGRIVVPLAKKFSSVVGVDVSQSMLEEASKNNQRNNLNNVSLELSDDRLSKIQGKFDFIHSFIVFQHIPKIRGEEILNHLVEKLNVGGVAALHFTYSWDVPMYYKFARWIRESIPLANNLVNLAKRRQFNEPLMLMTMYDMNKILMIIQNSCGDCNIQFTNHDNFLGAIIFFVKYK